MEKKWQDVSLDVIASLHNELSFFSAEGLKYYLPAFLLAMIRYPNEVGGLSIGIVFNLSPKSLLHHRLQIFAQLLTTTQKKAIANYFEVYKDLDPEGAWKNVEDVRQKVDAAIMFWAEQVDIN